MEDEYIGMFDEMDDLDEDEDPADYDDDEPEDDEDEDDRRVLKAKKTPSH